MMSRLLLALLIATTTPFAHGAPLRVAVADNFQATFEKLAAAYTKQSAEQVEGSYATTDELYKRISDGVPYAAFFAALRRRAGLFTPSAGSHCGRRRPERPRRRNGWRIPSIASQSRTRRRPSTDWRRKKRWRR
jgi:hypothetical protein